MKKSASKKIDWRVGLARVDITPEYPIRMAGYGFLAATAEDAVLNKARALARRTGRPMPTANS